MIADSFAGGVVHDRHVNRGTARWSVLHRHGAAEARLGLLLLLLALLLVVLRPGSLWVPALRIGGNRETTRIAEHHRRWRAALRRLLR